VAFEAFSLVGG